MGLFTLLFALGSTISETIRENAENRRALEERQRYENIDFDNIEYVTLDGTETAYRIETEEEFDPVMSDFLTQQDGWQHYETQTVEYEVENGENYVFTIKYKNGTRIHRAFHEASPLTERLLEYCNDDVNDYSIDDDYAKCNLDSLSKRNALKTARTHLQASSFSYAGLVSLLEYQKYSNEDAVCAADNCGADWNKQAIKKAKDYLDGDGFSYSGLIRLLEYEKFTPEQARYGVDNSGADWNEQAAKRAKSYLECFDYSRQRLVEQLKYEEFTEEQAEYAANAVGFTEPFSVVKHEQQEECFAVIDFETTGLNYNFRNPPMDEIISVAIIDQNGNELLNTYCDTVKIKTWYEAQRIHGIAPKDVKGYPTFAEIMPKVIEILSSYDYVISYNVPFEKSFLEGYARLYTPTDFSIHKVKWGEDPMEMFMDYMGTNRFQKLQTAAEHFGYTYTAHNALEDAKAALYVYNAIREY